MGKIKIREFSLKRKQIKNKKEKLNFNMKMNLDPDLSLYTKLNSKWTKDLSIRRDTLKLLEKKKRQKIHFNFSMEFLKKTW